MMSFPPPLEDYDASSVRGSSVLSTAELGSSASTLPNPTFRSQGSRARKTTANTWTHARDPKDSEPVRCARKNEKIYYCKYCIDPPYSTTVSTTFRYHLLSTHGMAIDILSIPAMSAEPERVFSGARRTISWDRCQLGSRTIEKGECMKSWIKSGITQGVPVELMVEESQDYDDGTTGKTASDVIFDIP